MIRTREVIIIAMMIAIRRMTLAYSLLYFYLLTRTTRVPVGKKKVESVLNVLRRKIFFLHWTVK